MAAGCSRNGNVLTDSDKIEKLENTLNRWSRNGDADSLFAVTRPVIYANEIKDTLLYMYAGVYNAQMFLWLENLDSTNHYLGLLTPYEKRFQNMPIGGMLYCIKAIYILKADYNFPAAIDNLYKGYLVFESCGDYGKAIVPLNNIVKFYYGRSDKAGLKYARLAEEISRNHDVEPYYKCVTSVGMAEMLMLSGQYEEAIPYLHRADSIAHVVAFDTVYPEIELLYADASNALGKEFGITDILYSKALDLSYMAEPAVVSLICLHYGQFLEDAGIYDKAKTLYEKGLSLSRASGNNEFRRNFLLHLANIMYISGDKEGAMEYYRMHSAHVDSISLEERERELQALQMAYTQAIYDQQYTQQELDLLKARQYLWMVSGISVLTATLLLSILLVYRKQKSMLRTLVSRYQMQASETAARNSSNSSQAYKELYEKVEKLMIDDRLFLNKDLTLERLAEIIGTNRTYISKAINIYSGTSFNSYLDKFRIREAVRMLETSGKVLMKDIADKVGYGSLATFYKSFSKETGCAPGKYRETARQLARHSKSAAVSNDILPE